jgi:hypothetical protein
MPRNSRALLSAEIRTSGEPGFATAAALMGFPAVPEPSPWVPRGTGLTRYLPFLPWEAELDEPEPPTALGD